MRGHFAPADAKKERRRFVYLTASGVEITERLAAESPVGPIFRNSRGAPWTAYSVSCRFDRLKEKVGRKLCLYLFRHAWVTRKLMAGVDSAIFKDLAGHADTQMINRVYGHVAQDWHFMHRQAQIDVAQGADASASE